MKKYYIQNKTDKCYYVRFRLKDELRDKPGVFMYTTDFTMSTKFDSFEDAQKEIDKKKIPRVEIVKI